MPFGSEQKFLQSCRANRYLWALRGDFHIGRWLRFLYLKKVLKSLRLKPSAILDAGCGDGQYSFYLEKFYPSVRIYGIDISEESIENCNTVKKEILSNVNFSKVDLEMLNAEKEYDLVIVNNVLSYVRDVRIVFKALSKSLKPQGVIVLQDMNRSFAKDHHISFVKNVSGVVWEGFEMNELGDHLRETGILLSVSKETFTIWGNLAHSIFDTLREHSFLRNLTFPLQLFFAYLDTIFPLQRASGLLMVGKLTS